MPRNNKNQKEYKRYDILGATYALPLMESGNKTKEQILMESTILFAKNGYAALSMRELAEAIGIKPASLYNYFKSKKALWNAVLDHAVDLYLLYFERMGEALNQVHSLEDMLNIIFDEPKKMRNLFTCYAFNLVQSEQFRNERSGKIFSGTFLEYSIAAIKKHFDRCVAEERVSSFDTEAAAAVIMHAVLIALNLRIQESLGQRLPYDYSDMMTRIQNMILQVCHFGCKTPLPEIKDDILESEAG